MRVLGSAKVLANGPGSHGKLFLVTLFALPSLQRKGGWSLASPSVGVDTANVTSFLVFPRPVEPSQFEVEDPRSKETKFEVKVGSGHNSHASCLLQSPACMWTLALAPGGTHCQTSLCLMYPF